MTNGLQIICDLQILSWTYGKKNVLPYHKEYKWDLALHHQVEQELKLLQIATFLWNSSNCVFYSLYKAFLPRLCKLSIDQMQEVKMLNDVNLNRHTTLFLMWNKSLKEKMVLYKPVQSWAT